MSNHARRASIAAVALYVVWTAATWFLEGRIETLLRPDAVADRVIYIVVANLLIGIVGAALVLRFATSSGGTDRTHTGFGRETPSALWIVAGIVMGLAFYFGQGAPSTHPIVIINAFAQVLAVSVAEVLVCWAVVGGVLRGALRGPPWAAAIGAAVAASLLFGIYHFGHSAPFNTIGMVALLSAVGLVTSVFFFISRDVYATIAFHNFLGVFGVVQALARADLLAGFQTLQPPLLATAVVSLAILILADWFVIRRGDTGTTA